MGMPVSPGFIIFLRDTGRKSIVLLFVSIIMTVLCNFRVGNNKQPQYQPPVYEKPSPRILRAGDVVPKIQLEEKEQELLSKDETIQVWKEGYGRIMCSHT